MGQRTTNSSMEDGSCTQLCELSQKQNGRAKYIDTGGFLLVFFNYMSAGLAGDLPNKAQSALSNQ
jgi:hypothetical protein